MDNVKVQSDNGNKNITTTSVVTAADNTTNIKGITSPAKNNTTALSSDFSASTNWKDSPKVVPFLDNVTSKVNGGPLNNNPLTTDTLDKKIDSLPLATKDSPKNTTEALGGGTKGADLKDADTNANLGSKMEGATCPSIDKNIDNVKNLESHVVVRSSPGKDISKASSDLTTSGTTAPSGPDCPIPAKSLGEVKEEDSKDQRPPTPFVKEIDEQKHKPVIDVQSDFGTKVSIGNKGFVIPEETSSSDVSPRKSEDKLHIAEEPAKAVIQAKAELLKLADQSPGVNTTQTDAPVFSKPSQDVGKTPIDPIIEKGETVPSKDIIAKADHSKVPLATTNQKPDLPSSNQSVIKPEETLETEAKSLDKQLPEPPKESPKSASPSKMVTEETDEYSGMEEVVEEVIMKREIMGTGKDDELIDAWRRSEEETQNKKKEEQEKGKQKEQGKDVPVSLFEDQIMPSKQPDQKKGSDGLFDDIVTTFGDFGSRSVDTKSPQNDAKPTKEVKELNQAAKETKNETKPTNQDIKKEPLKETKPEKSTNQDIKKEPLKETKPEKSTNQDIKKEPLKETKPEKPTNQDIKKEPLKETKPEKPTNQDIKKEPLKETKPEKPTNQDIKKEPLKETKPELKEKESIKKSQQEEAKKDVKDLKQKEKKEEVVLKLENKELNQSKTEAKETKAEIKQAKTEELKETKQEIKQQTKEEKQEKKSSSKQETAVKQKASNQEVKETKQQVKTKQENKVEEKMESRDEAKQTKSKTTKQMTVDTRTEKKPKSEKATPDPRESSLSNSAKLKQENEMKEHHKQIVKAVSKLLPEEGHDSGVDESTQSKDGASKAPPKDGRISPRKRQPRSVDPSPMKRTPQSTGSVERKPVPMNKIEVGKSASPNIKNVRSKIGSLDNATYRPGGGKIRIESKKLDFSKASSRIEAKNDKYTPGGGEKKIEVVKLKWNASSKVGSLDKKDHKPGGGDKKVESHKLNFKDKAESKIGSKENMKHKPGGGDVEKKGIKIPTEKLEFKTKASSKVGSLDNVKHKPKGGDRKIFDDKEYLRQMQTSSNASPCKTPTSKTSSGRASGAISPATTGTISPGPQEE